MQLKELISLNSMACMLLRDSKQLPKLEHLQVANEEQSLLGPRICHPRYQPLGGDHWVCYAEMKGVARASTELIGHGSKDKNLVKNGVGHVAQHVTVYVGIF